MKRTSIKSEKIILLNLFASSVFNSHNQLDYLFDILTPADKVMLTAGETTTN
ncbi:MAG: hypothetical protein HYZ10_08505 [Ignavibacteriales bacterium]|nr:hypothetical protein [Ignavibacteriales bacterium]